MRFILLSTLAAISLADDCKRFCRETSGICSSKGSHCKNKITCHDLYFTDETKSMACSSELADCPRKLQIECAEIPKALESILAPARVASASGSLKGKTAAEEESDKAVTKPIAFTESKKKDSTPPTTRTAKVGIREEEGLTKRERKAALRKGDKKVQGGSASSSSDEEDLASAIAMSLALSRAGPKEEGKKLIPGSTMERAMAMLDQDPARVASASVPAAEDKSEEPVPGVIGFRNIGSTCYLAAVMQVIGHARPLMASIRMVNPNPVALAAQEVLSQMWDGAVAGYGAPIAPRALLQAIHATVGDARQFVRWRMEDASEAMYIILNALDAASGLEGKSPVAKVLQSAQRNTKTCSVCKTASSRVEPQFQLHLPMPEVPEEVEVTLQDCLVLGGVEETIAEFHCPTCKWYTPEARSKTSISRTADLLMLTLRRFGADMKKVHTIIDYPLVLVASNGKAIYDLIGVIHHHGRTKDSGHYTAQVYHDIERKWLNADDSVVTSIESPSLHSKTAYMFLYQRRV